MMVESRIFLRSPFRIERRPVRSERRHPQRIWAGFGAENIYGYSSAGDALLRGRDSGPSSSEIVEGDDGREPGTPSSIDIPRGGISITGGKGLDPSASPASICAEEPLSKSRPCSAAMERVPVRLFVSVGRCIVRKGGRGVGWQRRKASFRLLFHFGTIRGTTTARDGSSRGRFRRA